MSRAPVLAIALALSAASFAGAGEPGYDLVRGAAPDARVGQATAVSLSILPRAGWRLLESGPVLVRLSTDGLRPARPLYRREDAVDPRAEAPRFELTFTPEREGKARLEADCVFYLCKDGRCRPVETTTSWRFSVAAAVTGPAYSRGRRP